MRNIAFNVAGATIALLSVLGTANAAPSAEHGKVMFMKKGCWECHGTQGQGAVTGPRLAPDPIPYDALSAFVRTTNRAMPPYREHILSDADLADIYAYLQSIPKPPDLKSVPLLNQWADKPK
jgi:mono/diheme cytochrome c family protein